MRFRKKFMKMRGWVYIRWGGAVFGEIKWRGLKGARYTYELLRDYSVEESYTEVVEMNALP